MTENSPFQPQPEPRPFGQAQPPAPQPGPQGPAAGDGRPTAADITASRRYDDLKQPARMLASDTELGGDGTSPFADKQADRTAAGPRPSAPRDDASERYGTKRRGMSTARKIGLGIVGLVILGGVAGYVVWENENPATQATVISYQVAGNSVDVTFEVDKAAGATATCTLEALDSHNDVVGSVNVQIPAGRAKNVMSYTVSTTSTPADVDVASCS